MDIKITNLEKYYQNNTKALENINLELKQNSFLNIYGDSGSGKSTLLRIIAGIIPYEYGNVSVNGFSYNNKTKNEIEDFRYKNIVLIDQQVKLIDEYTVYDNLVLSFYALYNKKVDRNKIDFILEFLKIKVFKHKRVKYLSGGEKQKVTIARALLFSPDILLFDEVLDSLDNKTSIEIMEIIKAISKDRTVIFVDHKSNDFTNYFTDRITLEDGKIIEEVKYKENSHQNRIIEKNESNKPNYLMIIKELFIHQKSIQLMFVFALMLVSFIIFFSNIFLVKINYSEDKGYESEIAYIQKRDKGIFSVEDIEELNQNFDNEYTYVKSIKNYNVSYGVIFPEYKDELSVGYFDKIFQKDIYIGRIPQKKNEVMINSNFSGRVGSTIKIIVDEKENEYLVVGSYYSYLDNNVILTLDERIKEINSSREKYLDYQTENNFFIFENQNLGEKIKIELSNDNNSYIKLKNNITNEKILFLNQKNKKTYDEFNENFIISNDSLENIIQLSITDFNKYFLDYNIIKQLLIRSIDRIENENAFKLIDNKYRIIDRYLNEIELNAKNEIVNQVPLMLLFLFIVIILFFLYKKLLEFYIKYFSKNYNYLYYSGLSVYKIKMLITGLFILYTIIALVVSSVGLFVLKRVNIFERYILREINLGVFVAILLIMLFITIRKISFTNILGEANEN
ncbi:ATP-binding cassette domain-containing protein [Haploplasma axanthum]|nr:ATP-binding cassette domain-containing protein [Haploplasma axanthum]